MVCSKLSPAADMDIGRQLIHITPKLILVVRRVKFCEANLQIEIIFGPGRSDGCQRLIKKPQRLWNFIGFAATQCLAHTFTGIHRDLLHIWYLVGLGKILNVNSVIHFAIPALIWPRKGAKSTKIKYQGL